MVAPTGIPMPLTGIPICSPSTERSPVTNEVPETVVPWSETAGLPTFCRSMSLKVPAPSSWTAITALSAWHSAVSPRTSVSIILAATPMLPIVDWRVTESAMMSVAGVPSSSWASVMLS